MVAVAVAAGLVAWFVVRHESSSNPPGSPAQSSRGGAVLISVAGLDALSRAADEPVYWVGSRAGTKLELTRTSGDRTFVRYLPTAAAIGTGTPYLTIGTYGIPNAFAATSAAERRGTSVRIPIRGGIAFYSKTAPTSVYVAFAGSDYQIEVYDPNAAEARALVRSGRVRPVLAAAAATGGARRITPAGLTALAKALRRSIYWAGARPGVTYELTAPSDGRVFVRYLPGGVPVGSSRAYLTIGTYPVADAYAVTRGLLRRRGVVSVPVGGGGVAVYSAARPTNVYVAYPGVAEQVEVYSPSPAQARSTVGRLAALRG